MLIFAGVPSAWNGHCVAQVNDEWHSRRHFIIFHLQNFLHKLQIFFFDYIHFKICKKKKFTAKMKSCRKYDLYQSSNCDGNILSHEKRWFALNASHKIALNFSFKHYRMCVLLSEFRFIIFFIRLFSFSSKFFLLPFYSSRSWNKKAHLILFIHFECNFIVFDCFWFTRKKGKKIICRHDFMCGAWNCLKFTTISHRPQNYLVKWNWCDFVTREIDFMNESSLKKNHVFAVSNENFNWNSKPTRH